MLNASTRVVAAAGSGLIDLHAPRVVDHADVAQQPCSCSVLREAVCASLTWICDVEQLYTEAALVLDASTRVVAAAGSGLIDLQVPRVVDHGICRINSAYAWSRKEADLASLICGAEQLYTDAALVLDASTRAAAAARSGLIDLRFALVIDHVDVSHQLAHVRSRKEADLASLGWI